MGFYDVTLFDCPPFRMFTANDCPRADNILIEKSFEPQSMKLWCALARTATAILDIGAHVGVYSLAAAALRPDLPIHAFEPNPYAAARLRVHRKINGFANIFDTAVALSNKARVSSFSWYVKAKDQISSGGTLGVKVPHAGVRSEISYVAGFPLDTFPLAFGARPLVKIDVEGSELSVIEGATQLAQARPDIILESFSQANCDAIGALLPAGFRVFKIIEDGRLEEIERLTAADRRGRDFNQFITWHGAPL